MKTLVTASAHFVQTPDGHLWTPNASLEYSFWTRYLDAYDEVFLLAQTKQEARPPADWNRATGPNITAVAIPDFLSPQLLLKNFAQVKRIVRNSLHQQCAVHLRLACFVGSVVWRALEKERPYGVEVVADPYDSFAPGAFAHPLRPLLRAWVPRELRLQCGHASGAAYVTREVLQRRYPPAPDAFSTHFSSINLGEQDLVAKPRKYGAQQKSFSLVTVGTLAQLYKAPDVLIEAVSIAVRGGLNIKLAFVGEGRFRSQLEEQVKAAGLAEHVQFRGQLSNKSDVQQELDAADLFVLPSRQEGLPRAMLEAMARALPCLGSTVGGIPELLNADEMVAPGDATALAKKIREVLCDPQRMTQMSARNLQKARDYEEKVLRARRVEFYRHVRDETAAWFRKR